MEILQELSVTFIEQLKSPTLAFLFAGMLVAAFNSKLHIPGAIYDFVVFMLLMRIGLTAGMEIRDTSLSEILLPAVFCMILGISITLLGSKTLVRLPGVNTEDGLATSGLFGAVSGATLAAGMMLLEKERIAFEGWVPALYPFMDIPALIAAIVLARMYRAKQEGGASGRVAIWPIIKDSLQGMAITAMLIGVALGLFTNPQSVYEGFYDPLFRGFLSVLMLILGMDAYKHLKDMAKVAHWYVAYGLVAPLVHGLMGFGLGYVAHLLVDLSPGGVIIMAVIAASNSDISGPPTLRAGIPSANPAAYIGTSTGVGTPIALVVGIPLFITLAEIVFGT